MVLEDAVEKVCLHIMKLHKPGFALKSWSQKHGGRASVIVSERLFVQGDRRESAARRRGQVILGNEGGDMTM